MSWVWVEFEGFYLLVGGAAKGVYEGRTMGREVGRWICFEALKFGFGFCAFFVSGFVKTSTTILMLR